MSENKNKTMIETILYYLRIKKIFFPRNKEVFKFYTLIRIKRTFFLQRIEFM